MDGANVANIAQFIEVVKAGDLAQARVLLAERPELVGMDLAENNEHRALHYAVLRRDVEMVRLLMEAGADARKGIFPHRDATSAYVLARDREYADVLAVIEDEERARRAEMSCPNATVSPIQDQINAAIRARDRDAAIKLLDADKSVIQACDRSGGTPLHAAAEQSDALLTGWLLERRANPNKEDLRGLTPLDRATLSADDGFAEVARLLIQHGAAVTIRAAVALGDRERVRELAGRDPGLLHQIGQGGGLLTLAVRHEQIEMVLLLLDLGADVDERVMLDQVEQPVLSWGTPLWHAALQGNFVIAQLLLDRGADPNANVYASGWPLRNAWNHPDDAVKRLLLERGARRQPYMVAEDHDLAEARRVLDADPGDELAQELAWSAADHGCAEIVKLAVARLPWRLDDPRWHWILIQPVRGGAHFDCLEALLQHGVDPNVARLGQTVLHFTAARLSNLSDLDRARFARMLLDAGARLDLRDDLLQSTPLGWACRWGRAEMVKLYLERGAPVVEKDAEPWAQPDAWARKMGHAAISQLLAG